MVNKVFERLFKTRAGFIIPLFLFSLLIACDSSPKALSFAGSVMGTTYHVTVVDAPAGLTESDLKSGVHAALAAVDAEMSTYKPDSALMQLNRYPLNQAMPVSPNLMKILLLSKQVFNDSDKAFDPTVGALVNLWGFGPRQVSKDELPSDSDIEQLKAAMGFDHLQLNTTEQSAARLADVFIDLSAIAKGFGVDEAARWLLSNGVTNFLVEVGGELRAHGYSPRGDRWVTAISQPDSGLQPKIHRRLMIDDVAVATSGDYYNFFEVDGVRYSHTIDPRTGKPVQHSLASVTVLAADCASADGYATAIDVLGPEKGLQMAEKLGLAVYIILRDGDKFVTRSSSAFDAYLASHAL